MSRSGYIDDDTDQKNLAMWRGRVASAIRGRRGQALLRDLRDALDAMTEKVLIADEIVLDGEVCALGAVAKHRSLPDIGKLDPENHDDIGEKLNISSCMVQEIEWVNDEGWHGETPEQRWKRVRRWVDENIRKDA